MSETKPVVTTENLDGLRAFQKFYTEALGKSEAVGFDFSMILLALMPVLMKQLTACLGSKTNDELAQKMASGDLFVKILTQRALRDVLKESGDKLNLRNQRVCVDGCLRGMSKPDLNIDIIRESLAMEWALA
tara:strand:- start:197 stop:592 length:396 start_codon:yes stop_codon:yes gene_type:complete